MLKELVPHLRDLQKALIRSAIAFFIMFFISFAFYEPILEFMMAPVKVLLPEGTYMIATGVQEAFFTAIKVSFFSGFIFALPYIFWQIWGFLAPGLYENEKRLIIPFVLFASTMFLIGVSFAFYIVVPYGFEFLINFGNTLVTVAPRIGEYVGFLTKLLVGFGIAFELPVFTLFLAKMDLITDRSLKDFFKYAVVIIFVLAALLTPPDLITQFLMAGPMIMLYGLSILIAKSVNPYKESSSE
jgi:sec-independent protein translocase protein TatC